MDSAGQKNTAHHSPRRAAVRKRKTWQRRKRRALLGLLILLLLLLIVLLQIHRSSHHEQIVSDGYTHAEQFSNCLIVDGIDVSYVQGSKINWKEVKKSGVDFAFIRAGYRSSQEGILNKDSDFERNIRAAKEAGVMIGLYFYSQALSAEEAAEEAEYLMELAGSNEIDLPLVFDYEVLEDGRLDQAIESGDLSSDEMYAAALAFCDAVEAKGYESAVYSNYSFLKKYLHPEELGERTTVWLAHYEPSTDYQYAYDFWQCGTMTVPGISKETDKNFWYVDPEAVYETRGARTGNAQSISRMQITIKKNDLTYIGLNVKPDLTVSDGLKPLKEGKDYRLGYIHNAAEGTGYVVITGIGEYRDAVVRSFEIKDLI
ncbi:MAG: hypothetical protein IJH75_04790 [Mogibacterium sp.]|nr:hypothetical protein [Mogibacterium sp.]